MAQLRGVNVVLANLRKKLAEMERVGVDGLIEAAIMIRRDMDARPPLIPVKTGNMRASWFIVAGGSVVGTKKISYGSPGFRGDVAAELSANHRSVVSRAKAGATRGKRRPTIAMGFSANYTLYVHEGDWSQGTRPGSGPKFFEAALKRNKANVLIIVANKMRLKNRI